MQLAIPASGLQTVHDKQEEQSWEESYVEDFFVWFLAVYLTKIFAQARFHVSLQPRLMLVSACFQADFYHSFYAVGFSCALTSPLGSSCSSTERTQMPQRKLKFPTSELAVHSRDLHQFAYDLHFISNHCTNVRKILF